MTTPSTNPPADSTEAEVDGILVSLLAAFGSEIGVTESFLYELIIDNPNSADLKEFNDAKRALTRLLLKERKTELVEITKWRGAMFEDDVRAYLTERIALLNQEITKLGGEDATRD